MNYKLKWGFGGFPPITMLICIDCVVYNQYIIHEYIPKHSRMLVVLCVVGDFNNALVPVQMHDLASAFHYDSTHHFDFFLLWL